MNHGFLPRKLKLLERLQIAECLNGQQLACGCVVGRYLTHAGHVLTVIDVDGLRCRIAAEVPEPIMGSARRSRADRLALQAAREAADDAGLGVEERGQAALLVGAVGGGMLEVEPWYWHLGKADRPRLPRAALRAILPSSHADVIGHALGLGGPRETLVMACSSGAASIAVGAELIMDGVTPVAV